MGKLIRFDWATKHILRDKANFAILEGLLSELLKTDISIVEILESERNKDDALDKFNRVDMLVKSGPDELILIEVQNSTEWDYFQRMLFGASKLITEYMQMGMPYKAVKKVITVHIVYFDLGQGADYVYKGSTRFVGLHQHDELLLNQAQQELFHPWQTPADIFPEYYLIKVEKFKNLILDRFDEWVYFLKNDEIEDTFQAKGLHEAKARLDVLKLSDTERKQYENHVENLRYEASLIWSSHAEGELKGRKEGREEGEEIGLAKGEEIGLTKGEEIGLAKLLEEKFEIARKMIAKGYALSDIAELTGLSETDLPALFSEPYPRNETPP